MANNNFKVFDENQTNIMSDEEYALHTQRADGVQSGVANSQLHNKIYRQATIMVKALADFIAGQEYDATDADAALLAQNLRDALSKFAIAPLNTHKTKTPLDHPDGSVTTPKLSDTGVAAGTYKSVTVDVKGRVTGGTNPTTLGGYGITDAYPKSTSDARYLPIRGKAVDAEKADNISVTDLGSFFNKTIRDLRTSLRAWIDTLNGKFGCCTFRGETGGVSFFNKWNAGDDSVINPGGQWTVTALGNYPNGSYRYLLFTCYFNKNIYTAALRDGVWSNMDFMVLSADLIQSINGVSTIAGGAVDLSSVFLKINGSNASSLLIPSRVIGRMVDNDYLEICGGNGYTGGAFISLKGKNHPSDPNSFYIDCAGKKLYGKPNGSLTWENKNLIRSINNIDANSAGNVTLPAATTSSQGLMSAADKSKLNGIEANANKYTLPPAGASVLGGIKVGANLGISNGVLSGAYATATTSAPGLLRRLSGNANDVMTGTGAWVNTAWKQAFFGSFTTTGNVICTLPATWKECFFYVSTQGYSSHCEPLGPVTPGIKGIPICQTGDSGVELLLNINASNQVTMTNRGGASDGIVRGVFYR